MLPRGKTTQKLLVYLIDHGQRHCFRLDADEFLEAAEYDSWLDSDLRRGRGDCR